MLITESEIKTPAPFNSSDSSLPPSDEDYLFRQLDKINMSYLKVYKDVPPHDANNMRAIRNLCKKSKFDHTNKWYMHKMESVLESVSKFLV